MINQVTGYVATCDKCEDTFSINDSEQAVFDDAFVAEQIINDAGWRKINGQLLCEDCYQEFLNNEEEENQCYDLLTNLSGIDGLGESIIFAYKGLYSPLENERQLLLSQEPFHKFLNPYPLCYRHDIMTTKEENSSTA